MITIIALEHCPLCLMCFVYRLHRGTNIMFRKAQKVQIVSCLEETGNNLVVSCAQWKKNNCPATLFFFAFEMCYHQI